MLIDLYVHVGDQGLSVPAVLSRIAELGLDGVVVAADGAIPQVQRDAAAEGGPALFAGAVVDTDRGRYLTVFPHPEKLPPLKDVFGANQEAPWAVRDVVARTAALGGAVVALSPYDATIPHPGGDILYTLPHLSAVQSVSPRHPGGLAEPAIEAAECLGLPCVGASGARTSVEEVGQAGTLFAQPIRNEEELIAALRSGACWPVEFGLPSPDLLHRGRSSAPRPAAAASAPPPAEGGERRRRRRRR